VKFADDLHFISTVLPSDKFQETWLFGRFRFPAIFFPGLGPVAVIRHQCPQQKILRETARGLVNAENKVSACHSGLSIHFFSAAPLPHAPATILPEADFASAAFLLVKTLVIRQLVSMSVFIRVIFLHSINHHVSFGQRYIFFPFRQHFIHVNSFKRFV
jgi:hypothetical protein